MCPIVGKPCVSRDDDQGMCDCGAGTRYGRLNVKDGSNEVWCFRYLPSDCFNGKVFPVVPKCLSEIIPGILLFVLVVEPL